MRRCAQCHGRFGLGSASAICGVGTGGFICVSRHRASKPSDADAPRRHLTRPPLSLQEPHKAPPNGNFRSLLGRFLFLLVFFTSALNVDSDSGAPC